MRKRTSGEDHHQTTAAARPAEFAAGPPAAKKNPAAVALGRLGGRKGGFARAAKMSAEERTESARKAALARWARRRFDPRRYCFPEWESDILEP